MQESAGHSNQGDRKDSVTKEIDRKDSVTKEIEKIAYVYIDKRFFNFLPLERVVSKISKRYLYTHDQSSTINYN